MKKGLILLIAILIVLSMVGCSFGVSQEKFDEFKASYDSLDIEYASLKAKNVLLQADYYTLVEETKAFTKLSDEEKDIFIEAIDNRDIIIEMNNEIEEKSNQIIELDEKIASLKSEVIKISSEPKKYPAGYLYAGTDFEVGRYKIHDGSSNFMVKSSSGESRVNIILGGKYGVEEYIYKFSLGDEVEARGSFKMVSIE